MLSGGALAVTYGTSCLSAACGVQGSSLCVLMCVCTCLYVHM